MVEDWVEEYNKLIPTYGQLASTMKDLLTHLLKQEQIDYLHPVQSRTKPLMSFQEKITRKKYTDPIKEITDLAGIRVIVFYPDEIARVKDVIEENFKVDPKNTVDKAAQLAKDRFSYGGINYVVSLKKDRLELSEYRKFRGLKFEIQLLTLCQYAWAEIQRKIEYKSEELIPPELSRRLSRLLALFDLADDEFAAIRDEGIEVLRGVPLSRVSVKQFAGVSLILKTLMKKAYQMNFLEMDLYEDNRYLTEMLEASSLLGFKNIAALERFLSSEDRLSNLIQSIEKHAKPVIRAGSISLCLMLIYHSEDKFSRSFLSKKGWKEPVLSILVDRVSSH